MGFKSPIVGSWYRDLEQDQLFEVVAFDEEQGAVEVQYLDGAISEFDLETWPQLPLTPAAPPEDSDAAYEVSQEDRWGSDDIMIPDNGSNPLAYLEPDSFPGIEDF